MTNHTLSGLAFAVQVPPPDRTRLSSTQSRKERWKTSKEVFHCNYKIYQHKVVSVGSCSHRLTVDNHIITFDVDKELSVVIELPGPVMEGNERFGCAWEILKGISTVSV